MEHIAASTRCDSYDPKSGYVTFTVDKETLLSLPLAFIHCRTVRYVRSFLSVSVGPAGADEAVRLMKVARSVTHTIFRESLTLSSQYDWCQQRNIPSCGKQQDPGIILTSTVHTYNYYSTWLKQVTVVSRNVSQGRGRFRRRRWKWSRH